jgi:hypothetical protein
MQFYPLCACLIYACNQVEKHGFYKEHYPHGVEYNTLQLKIGDDVREFNNMVSRYLFLTCCNFNFTLVYHTPRLFSVYIYVYTFTLFSLISFYPLYAHTFCLQSSLRPVRAVHFDAAIMFVEHCIEQKLLLAGDNVIEADNLGGQILQYPGMCESCRIVYLARHLAIGGTKVLSYYYALRFGRGRFCFRKIKEDQRHSGRHEGRHGRIERFEYGRHFPAEGARSTHN